MGGQLRRPVVLELQALGVMVMKKNHGGKIANRKGLCLWETDGGVQEVEKTQDIMAAECQGQEPGNHCGHQQLASLDSLTLQPICWAVISITATR